MYICYCMYVIIYIYMLSIVIVYMYHIHIYIYICISHIKYIFPSNGLKMFRKNCVTCGVQMIQPNLLGPFYFFADLHVTQFQFPKKRREII